MPGGSQAGKRRIPNQRMYQMFEMPGCLSAGVFSIRTHFYKKMKQIRYSSTLLEKTFNHEEHEVHERIEKNQKLF